MAILYLQIHYSYYLHREEEFGRSWLYSFGDTSAATALASKFAAELYYSYSNLWPETIRGLIVHAADWTPAMLNNRTIRQLSETERKKLIQQVGYEAFQICTEQNTVLIILCH